MMCPKCNQMCILIDKKKGIYECRNKKCGNFLQK